MNQAIWWLIIAWLSWIGSDLGQNNSRRNFHIEFLQGRPKAGGLQCSFFNLCKTPPICLYIAFQSSEPEFSKWTQLSTILLYFLYLIDIKLTYIPQKNISIIWLINFPTFEFLLVLKQTKMEEICLFDILVLHFSNHAGICN